MKAKAGDLTALLERALMKSGRERSGKGFTALADDIGKGIKDSYLQKKIHEKTNGADPNDEIGLREELLDIIAGYVGYPSYKRFVQSLSVVGNPILESCAGQYYSYVRMNNRHETVLLRSPVRIYDQDGKYFMELKGKENLFKGELTLQDTCLFISLKSQNGKLIHHIYKIGKNKSPDVMQGIFCAVTSMFDPIGGRVVLTKVKVPFEKLTIGEITSSNMGKEDADKILFQYLQNFSENNLAIAHATTCTIRDLVTSPKTKPKGKLSETKRKR